MTAKTLKQETIDYIGSKHSFFVYLSERVPPYDDMDKMVISRSGKYAVTAFDHKKKGTGIIFQQGYEKPTYAYKKYDTLVRKYRHIVFAEDIKLAKERGKK